MSVSEQLGQLAMEASAVLDDVALSSLPESSPLIADIKEGRVGSFSNVVGTVAIRRLQKIAVDQSPHGIPLLFGFNVIRGHRTIFPNSLAEASSWDPGLAERTARVSAIEADAQGVHWTFAPNADVARGAHQNRVGDTFGDDPFLTSEMVKAKVRGFQTSTLGGPGTLAATLKHFVGYGAAPVGRVDSGGGVSLSPTDLFNTHLPPFVEGVASGARVVMTSPVDLDSVPMSLNKPMISDLLRSRIGFKGVVLTSESSLHRTIEQGVARDDRDAGRKALRATVDVDWNGRSFRSLDSTTLAPPLNAKEKDEIRQSARRVLELKWDVGLFSAPYRNLDPEKEASALLTGDSRRLAREAVASSTVLLKNSGVLPLKKNVSSVALIGPVADDPGELLGFSHAMGRLSEVHTIRESLGQPGFCRRLAFAMGAPSAHEKRTSKAALDEALRIAKRSDVTIAVVGGASGLPDAQVAMLRGLRKSAKKLVTIVVAAKPLALKEVLDLSDAVLYAWEPGTEAGGGLRDLLFADAIPSAKTSISFPQATDEPPALIPFGFGMSYAKFEYGEMSLSKDELVGDGADFVTVRVAVKNVGAYDASEIIQLYVRDEFASIRRPALQLKGFQKLAIKQGEGKVAEFRIGIDDLSFFDARLERVAEPGTFQMMVGPDSAHLARKRLTLK